MHNKIIYYIGRYAFPDGAASGTRVYHVGVLLRELGYDVRFISAQDTGRQSDFIEPGKYSYDNFEYYPQGETAIRGQGTAGFIKYFTNPNTFQTIRDLCLKEKPAAIICYGPSYLLTNQLIRFCKNENIEIIMDVVEWYNIRRSRSGLTFLRAVEVNLRIPLLDTKINKIIAISPFLQRYYASRGCEVLWLPPTFPCLDDQTICKHFSARCSSPRNIIYAGSPGKKDLIVPALRAILQLNHSECKIVINLYGISEAQVSQQLNITDPSRYGIICHGTVPRQTVLDQLPLADFGLLLRENMKYARAGFSTKLAECMSLGVAMICNRIGGSDAILTDLVDGILIDNTTVHSLTDCFNKLSQMTDEEVLRLKLGAAGTARKLFSAEMYHDTMQQFLTKS